MNRIRTIKFGFIVIVLFSTLLTSAFASTKIYYRGMHFGKAWININGRLTKLSLGETSKEGVKLLSVGEKRIAIIIDGKLYLYYIGEQEGVLLNNEVVIPRDPSTGAYYVKGEINSRPVTFIVDTGASLVVLSKNLARELKIKYGQNKIMISTATKEELAYLVTLKSVRIGGIELNKIPAIITLHRNNPPMPLLGMSFLEKVEISQTGDQMTLKYDGK